MRDSILYTTLKAFLIAMFSIIGLCMGIFLLVALFSLFGEGDSHIEHTYVPEIIANAKGIRKQLSKDAPVVLQVDINGVIGTDIFNMSTVQDLLQESREGFLKNDRVKAILLKINSPGGTVSDSDGIYRAIKEYKARFKVPVIAYVDGICASGGMYIASSADEIYASDTSLIGSVGVLSPPFMNVSKLLDKVGVDSVTFTAGKNKDEMNPFRPWKEGEGDNLKGIIQDYYQQFVTIVTTNRPKLNKEELIKDYGANMFVAQDALAKGYIDGAGVSYDDTLKILLKKIGIEDDYYQVVRLQQNWFVGLFRSESPLLTGKVSHDFNFGAGLRSEFMGQYLYLYCPQ